MNIDLTGRHALVCGGSAGIGRAAAIELAALGADVTVLARTQAALDETKALCSAAGPGTMRTLVADLEERDALQAAVEGLATEAPVHILINNQGGPPSGPLLDATDDAFLRAYGRIQLASHRLVQTCLPDMKETGYGRIVNVLSTSVREPIDGLGIGNTVRASMAAWAKTLSRELPPGITINSVLPGATDTERLTQLSQAKAERLGQDFEEVYAAWYADAPEGRLGRPEELGQAIAFLCSPAASFVRGVCLPVDGGRLRAT